MRRTKRNRLRIRNNEFVLTMISSKSLKEFWIMLHSYKKDVTARKTNDTIYVCLSEMDTMRKTFEDNDLDFAFDNSYYDVIKLMAGNFFRIIEEPSHCYIQSITKTPSGEELKNYVPFDYIKDSKLFFGGPKLSNNPFPFKQIIKATSYFDKKKLRSQSFKKQRISGYNHLLDLEKGRFPSGLLESVLNIFDAQNIKYEVVKTFNYPEKYLDLNPVWDFEPTQDQISAVNHLDKANKGIGKLPTGFGKTSYVSIALIAKKGVRTLFLANQRILINDAKEDFERGFENDGVEIGIIGDGNYDPKDITVASIQGIIAALNPPTIKELELIDKEINLARMQVKVNPKPTVKANLTKLLNRKKKMEYRINNYHHIKKFLKTVDMFIIDEGQVIGTKMWDKFFEACPAAYRYTLTATDTRTDGGRLEIVAATGERKFVSSAEEQIKKNRLSEFIGHFKKFDHNIDKDVIKNMDIPYYLAYEHFIVENKLRNEYLCDWVMKWYEEKYYILALVTRKQHGENVKEILTERGLEDEKDFFYVDGQTPKKKRREIIDKFRSGEFHILIGTSIFDVGFNAKNASKMVRFNAGSSEVRETQRAGRTVRKRDDGVIGETIDLIDLNVPYFQSQGWKRLDLLRSEFGSKRANILPGVVKGNTPIAKLENVAEELEPMAQHELLEAVNRIKSFEEANKAPTEEVDTALDEIFNDSSLSDIAKEMSEGEFPSMRELFMKK